MIRLRAKDPSLTAQGDNIYPFAALNGAGPSIGTFRFSTRNWSSFTACSYLTNRIVAFSLLMLLIVVFYAANPANQLLANEQTSMETRALNLDQQLMCPVCPGETLHQSQVTLAKQMKQIIRDRLAAGESEETIVDYFVSVYGESILASPPKRGIWLIAWVIPFIALIFGTIIVVTFARSLKRATTAANDYHTPDA